MRQTWRPPRHRSGSILTAHQRNSLKQGFVRKPQTLSDARLVRVRQRIRLDGIGLEMRRTECSPGRPDGENPRSSCRVPAAAKPTSKIR